MSQLGGWKKHSLAACKSTNIMLQYQVYHSHHKHKNTALKMTNEVCLNRWLLIIPAFAAKQPGLVSIDDLDPSLETRVASSGSAVQDAEKAAEEAQKLVAWWRERGASGRLQQRSAAP